MSTTTRLRRAEAGEPGIVFAGSRRASRRRDPRGDDSSCRATGSARVVTAHGHRDAGEHAEVLIGTKLERERQEPKKSATVV
jgi:hypothetical protein